MKSLPITIFNSTGPVNFHNIFNLNTLITNIRVDNNKQLIDELANLLNDTAEAHHKAFAATEGEDPDWPIWYADYLLDKMRKMLNAKFTKSELIYLLVLADKENASVAPGAYWPRFYANFIINRYI